MQLMIALLEASSRYKRALFDLCGRLPLFSMDGLGTKHRIDKNIEKKHHCVGKVKDLLM